MFLLMTVPPHSLTLNSFSLALDLQLHSNPFAEFDLFVSTPPVTPLSLPSNLFAHPTRTQMTFLVDSPRPVCEEAADVFSHSC